jgi:hypothetical protein
MKHLLTCFFFLTSACSYAQYNGKQSCKVEIYLLKTEIPDTTVEGLKGPFAAKLSDLQDTAFIKDAEILSYSMANSKAAGFKVTPTAGQKLNKEGISLSSGRQFALVANGQIVYTGYFWNSVSSFGCAWITAYISDGFIMILKGLPPDAFTRGYDHILENKLLLDCLRSTNRLTDK